jgi:Reverse transcriptase (RNA-dependent DNA polymerase)
VLSKPARHSKKTENLARSLQPKDIYNWLVTIGYFPEAYVLPPCFHVQQHPIYGTVYFPVNNRKYRPKISQLCELHFPKSDLTDRTFSIIDPEIHNDIAIEFANNWDKVLDTIFHPDKCIYSYSFPIPVDASHPGSLGKLRSGRMIYEYIEMAENDLVEEAYRYKYLIRTDIKNFYPSVYTHSIAWALHTKSVIRAGNNRSDPSFLGNRLDKLFQNANDGCTNGLPIGPAVSDLISEVILSAIDLEVSRKVKEVDALAVRFKDDYWFLCKSRNECQGIIKCLQKNLKEYNLLPNEDKTDIRELPEGMFREWVSKYYQIRPDRGKKLSFKEFKELYLGVLRIDRENPGTGIIDRFIADIMDKQYNPLIPVDYVTLNKSVSLLLLLAERRIKTFPKILGFIEAMMIKANSQMTQDLVEQHLNLLLKELIKNWEDNRYLISWILYFLKSNCLSVPRMKKLDHPILESIKSNKNGIFNTCNGFRLYRRVSSARTAGILSYHLDVFKP